ncbi:MAG TPA: hypothetical protein PKH77_05310 [Anaerolineae bacterium]|nr:hypothetical protein [Anaerolineae bacterium]
MSGKIITAENLLKDIFEAEASLRWFEQKYSLLSETFYRMYQRGQLRDEDPDEIQEYMEWSGWYEIHQDRCQRYEQAIEQRLRELTTPASLFDLHISQLHIPVS